jgi:PAS domain S-box-containing protein
MSLAADAYANNVDVEIESPLLALQLGPKAPPCPSLQEESDARYRLALDATDTGVWDLDVLTDTCYFSPYCFEMLGYQKGGPTCDIRDWFHIIHPEDVNALRRAKRDCISSVVPKFRVEFRIKTTTGKWRWMLCKGKAIGWDESGKATRMIGTLVDVSQTRVMQQMLRMEHNLLDLITATSPVGMMFVEEDGHVGFANPRAEEILGMSKDQIVRRGYHSPVWQITTYTNANGREKELPLREVLIGNKSLKNACFALNRPNGERALLSVNTAPFLDPINEVGGTVVILEDVTEQKQHEQVLAESDRLLRETQRIAQLGSYVLDLAQDRWVCSAKLLEILGIDETFPLTLIGHFEIVHPDFRQPFIDSYLNSVTRTGHFEMEYKVVRVSDGVERWVAECSEVSRDGSGAPSRMIGTIQDITERKAAEEAIRNLNEDLDRRVIERTSQLAAAKQEIESFSYSVSHDLRAPLRHINSYSAILVEEFGPALPTEAREYLDRICGASKRMGNLIDDLLTLTRVSRADMKRQSFDISSVAAQVAQMLSEGDPERQATFVIEKGLKAYGDSALVRLVLENLLGNALKYAGRGRTARIEFGQTSDVKGKPAFFVRDDGVGFDMEYSGNMFQPFQRLHGSEFEGTGIGLATVKRIIERHGGTVWAEGKVDEGATFYFRLSSSSRR